MPFLQMTVEERRVIFLPDTFQYDSLKIIGSHNHTRLGGIALHMFYTRHLSQCRYQTIVTYHGSDLIRLYHIQTGYQNIRP